MSEIRNCTRADMAAVAALFQRTFRSSDEAAPRSLEAYFAEAYLDHPWYDPDLAPRVNVNDEGRVTGFIGVFPGRFEHAGATLRAAIAGSLMVENPEREPLAGAKLLRSVIKGPQEITISETTNLVSQRLWEPLGGMVVTAMSLDWFRPLRPVGAALSALAEKRPGAAMLASIARAADWIVRPWAARQLEIAAQSPRLSPDREPADEDLADAIERLSRGIAFRPAWGKAEIAWLLSHAARKERYGTFHRAILRARGGEPAGIYLFHGEEGGIGRVLQALSAPGRAGDVLDCLLQDAARLDLSGLRGRATPHLTEALLTRKCVFLHRASTMIRSADRELLAAVRTGDALITGLAGESWTRLVGGQFT